MEQQTTTQIHPADAFLIVSHNFFYRNSVFDVLLTNI